MAYPMTHLCIAWDLAPNLPVQDVGAFLLGTLAPDAYRHGKAEKSLSDRAASHLSDPDTSLWMTRITERFRGAGAMEHADFQLDYCLHLIVDVFWQEAIILPLAKKNLLEDTWSYQEYAHDMAIFDVKLYHDADCEAHLWPYLRVAEPIGLDDMISAEQVSTERDLTLTWYARHTDLLTERLKALSADELRENMKLAAGFALGSMNHRILR